MNLANPTKREVPEWIGKSPDSAIPKAVKLRVLLRCGGKCYRSGHKFRPGDPIEYDHVIALANGGENRESNLATILGGKVHQEKTANDRAEQRKTERVMLKHAGLWPKGQKIASRGFEKRRGFR